MIEIPSSCGHKPIRSFVHRQSGLTLPRRQALACWLDHYQLPIDQGYLEWEAIFQRKAPVTLEIGFGMGHHLLAQAQRYPERNFVGLEVHRPGIAAVLLEIERKQLRNIRLIVADAVEVLQRNILEGSVDCIQIFFPDPWPKRRHHKRRLIQPAFCTLLRKKLKVGAHLQLATDWEDYAQQMLCVLDATSGLHNLAGVGCFSPRLPERSITKFEQRALNLGHVIRDLQFVAIDSMAEK
jgi:tRNA (guanine-N7-)-methyltransferase